MNIAHLTDIISFQKESYNQDDWGQNSKDQFVENFKVWAKIIGQSAKEITVNNEIIYKDQITIIIRNESRDINIDDRFTYNESVYEIVAIEAVQQGKYKGTYFQNNEAIEIRGSKLIR